MRRSLLTFAAAAAMVLAIVAPASAKSIGHLGASCSAGTAGYGIYQQQGSQVTLGFGAGGNGSVGTWHTTVTDNGTAVPTTILDYTGYMGVPSWTVSTAKTFPRGFHYIAIQADNLTTGESCVSGVNFKN